MDEELLALEKTASDIAKESAMLKDKKQQIMIEARKVAQRKINELNCEYEGEQQEMKLAAERLISEYESDKAIETQKKLALIKEHYEKCKDQAFEKNTKEILKYGYR